MKKAERINRVRNSLDEDELVRRLPEIEFIENDEIRNGVKETFLKGCPDYFWVVPTSSTGKYHVPDERGEYGNWIHTKRVFTTYCLLSRTYVEQGLITEYERECGKAAVLLHDMLKYGWPSEKGDHTVSDHDIIGAEVADHIGKLPEEVYAAIDAHNGGWADGKDPENDWEQIMHLSDYVAAKELLGSPAIIEPAEELQEEFDLPVVSEESYGLLI